MGWERKCLKRAADDVLAGLTKQSEELMHGLELGMRWAEVGSGHQRFPAGDCLIEHVTAVWSTLNE